MAFSLALVRVSGFLQDDRMLLTLELSSLSILSLGKFAKVAIEAAVEYVNSNPALLKGTKLKLAMQDTKPSNGFLGIVEGTSSKTSFCLFIPIMFSLVNA